MTKEEYVKKLKKIYRDNLNLAEDNSYGSGYCDALGEAIDLASTLDEPKKVVIPQFVDEWITKAKANFTEEPLYTAEVIANAIDEGTDYHFDWLEDVENQKLLLNAIANGYEVEKEKKYRLKLPGLIGSNGQQYISKSMDNKLFACAYRDYLEQEFTKEELEKFPNWVQQLKPEEVKDDND